MTDKFTHIPAAYEIVSLEYIDEIKSQAALLRHRKTGARIAVLANDDENKTFNIGFRTPPTVSYTHLVSVQVWVTAVQEQLKN